MEARLPTVLGSDAEHRIPLRVGDAGTLVAAHLADAARKVATPLARGTVAVCTVKGDRKTTFSIGTGNGAVSLILRHLLFILFDCPLAEMTTNQLQGQDLITALGRKSPLTIDGGVKDTCEAGVARTMAALTSNHLQAVDAILAHGAGLVGVGRTCLQETINPVG